LEGSKGGKEKHAEAMLQPCCTSHDAVPALRTSRCALGLKVSQFVIRLVIFSQLSQASDFNVLDPPLFLLVFL